MEIGIQGVQGSFHNEAASAYFVDKEIAIQPFHDFRSLAKSIQAKEMDYGVMAIENTIAGTILPNYALINEYDLKITGEIYTRIEMNLIAHKGKKAADLDQVFSHPMALLQCADFLANYPKIKLSEYGDTADSVRMIRDKKMEHAGAIASKSAASIFDMDILDSNIETNKKNYTRFLIMKSRMNGHDQIPQKASLRVITKHDPGALADVLLIFKLNGINMTKIQSMPILGKPYQYAFNIDVVWEDYDNYKDALHALSTKAELVKVHGEYKKGNIPTV